MNLPAKLPSFDKWVASEPVKIEKIEKIEKNEIITQQPEPQKVVIEDNKPINNTITSLFPLKNEKLYIIYSIKRNESVLHFSALLQW